MTDLHKAAAENDVATIRELIAGGADVNEADAYGLTPLFHAAHAAHPEAVRVLLKLGAEVARWDAGGEALMHWAVEDGSPETLQILLDAGADPNQRAPRGWTGLHEAGLLNRPEMARVLLEAGADPNVRETDYGTTPLLLAARYVDWDDDNGERAAELVRLLVEHGADVTVSDPEGETPLDAVASAGNRELAELLLAHGATHTPHTAARLGEAETVARLLDEGADPNDRDWYGSTPLHVGADTLEVVRELLRHGADANARDSYSETPLHRWAWGAESETAPVAEALLQAGAQLEAVNDDGQTPLLYAVDSGSAEAVEVLLRLGADPMARNSDGLTAAEAARAEGYEEIARIIEGWPVTE